MLIKRCLAHGIRIYPYELDYILQEYVNYKIPDDDLSKLIRDDLNNYVRGLYLISQEMSREWSNTNVSWRIAQYIQVYVSPSH